MAILGSRGADGPRLGYAPVGTRDPLPSARRSTPVVVQVLYSGLGGHGSVAFSLVRGDRGRTFRHGMIFYGVEDLAPGYAEACNLLGVSYATTVKRRGLDVKSWLQVAANLRGLAPDLVVLHSAPASPPVLALARFLGAPVVLVEHLANQVKGTSDWVWSTAAHQIAARTVVLTPTYGEELAQRLGRLYRRRRVRVIPNGIDVERFAEARRAQGRTHGSGPRHRVGMHSRFTPTKDHRTLIAAVARMPDVELLLAGDGGTRPEAEELARQLGVASRVRFVGSLPEEALPAFLAGLDVFVQATLAETMSTAVMQAMAAGLPVVGSDVGGVREMIRVGHTGLLVPPKDPEAMAAALGVLLRDEPRARALGEAAQAYARRTFSQERMFADYSECFAELGVAGTPMP